MSDELRFWQLAGSGEWHYRQIGAELNRLMEQWQAREPEEFRRTQEFRKLCVALALLAEAEKLQKESR